MRLLGISIMTVVVLGASAAQERGSVADYRRTPQAARALVERAVSIKAGDAKSVVLDKLGTPDHDQILMRNQRQEIVGRSMTYDIVKWKRGLVNELDDEYVDIFLDPNDVVMTVAIRVKLTGK